MSGFVVERKRESFECGRVQKVVSRMKLGL